VAAAWTRLKPPAALACFTALRLIKQHCKRVAVRTVGRFAGFVDSYKNFTNYVATNNHRQSKVPI
jgi:hypothetical protein